MNDHNQPLKLSPEQQEALLDTLQARFESHLSRHEGVAWKDVQAKLETQPGKIWSLHQMEQTGGEPDIVDYDGTTDTYIFYDCAAESPTGRRSLCYDREAWEARKKNKPQNNVMDVAAEMGIELLTEEQYRTLQTWGAFDTKTSSWLKTPAGVRERGGAIFGDFRYGRVFIYHNGAGSYYAARGFRGS